jgi:hypothetical protein
MPPGNNAEYGQVGDVTTISKSGTNQIHGDGFWYSQNAALNALNYGELTKSKLIANDFGASFGGPVLLPWVYNGKDKTLFYGTYEGFRYPRTSTIQDEVPSQRRWARYGRRAGHSQFNAGLGKYFNLTGRFKIKVEASFTNALNHVNLANPVLQINMGAPIFLWRLRSIVGRLDR